MRFPIGIELLHIQVLSWHEYYPEILHARRHPYIHTIIGFASARLDGTRIALLRALTQIIFLFPDLSRVACNLTIFREERHVHRRGDSIVMDHERNFSRGGQTDGRTDGRMSKKCTFSSLSKKEGDNRRRAFGMYLGEPRNMRRTRDLLGEFSIGSYLPPPVLPAPNGRPMIDNGESGSPTFFFFFF